MLLIGDFIPKNLAEAEAVVYRITRCGKLKRKFKAEILV
jgi:hypothetical protein